MTEHKIQKGLDRAHVLVTAFGFLVALTSFISTSTAQPTNRDRHIPIRFGEVLGAVENTARASLINNK